MKSLKPFFLLIFLSFSIVSSSKVYAQQRNARYQKPENENSCRMTLQQVQNKNFQMANGSKQIVTYAVSGFEDQEDCWKYLKHSATQITRSSEIAAVYFFTLPPGEIAEVSGEYKDFSQYGKNLIAEFWKDPDSGMELNRYPNVALPEN